MTHTSNSKEHVEKLKKLDHLEAEDAAENLAFNIGEMDAQEESQLQGLRLYFHLKKLMENEAVRSYVARHASEILEQFELVLNTVSMEEAVEQARVEG